MRIQHNIPAMNAYRNYNNNTSALSKNLEKLSSGYKINRAGDDAAGLAISEKMRAQITGLKAAQKNVKDGTSLVKTAEGAMQEIHDMLNRMDYLATQSANGTYDNEVDRLNLQKEVDSLKAEINRIADSANFNGIKLLDGSLGAKTSGAMETGKLDAVDMMDGITINAPEDGAGAKQTYELKFSDPEALFGAGDKIEFKLTNTEDNKVETFTVEYAAAAATGKFTGATTADQLKSIADAINGATSSTGGSVAFNTTGYKAEVNATGDGIVFTNSTVGAPKYTMDPASVVVTDAQSTLTTAETNKGGVNKSGTSEDTMALELLGATSTGASTPLQIDAGDTLQFNFNVNGQTMKVTLEAGKDFQVSSTKDISETTTNIVNALKNAKFDDDAATKGMDESLLKVDDYFDLTANQDKDGNAANGQIQVEADATNADATKFAVGIGNVSLFKGTTKDAVIAADASGSSMTPATTVTATKDAGTTFAAAVGDTVHDISATPSANYSEGEKIKLTGKLKDGRDFEIELTATNKTTPGTNEFKIGAAATNSVDNIKSALLGNDAKLTVKNADGTTSEIDAKTVFTADGANGTLKVENATGALKVSTPTNSVMKGISAEITSIESTNKAPVVGKLEETAAGADQASSVNKLTFDPAKVEQGTTLTIDGKTYEFVDASGLDADSGKNTFVTKEGNVAVAVTGLNAKTATGKDLANALKDAMGGDEYTSADNAKYDVTVDGSSLTIKSQVVGETAKALSVEQGESKPTSSVTFTSTPAGTVADPSKVKLNVKAGDTVTINGQTYEFIEAGKRTSAQENEGIELTDSINTPEAAAKALADAVNKKDGANIIARADGGSVIFTSKYKADAEKDEIAYTYAAPEIDLPKTSKGLTLQIGDTADKFNQMSVEVGDMHTKAMGIDGISVATQEGAQAAIDVIKNAINYVSGVRGDLGAVQNRLDHTANNLSVMAENIQDAESTIRDTDVAEEMMSYVKNNILVQSAQAMLAQANQLPQGVLQLLG